MFYRTTRNLESMLLLVSLLVTLCVGSLRAAEQALTADVEVLFPVPPGGRGGGTAAVGDAQMEVAEAADHAKFIRLASKRGPVAGSWWFPGHRPMTPEQALIGQPNARIAIDVKSRAAVKTDVTVQWRGTGETLRSGEVDIGPDKATHVEFKLPQPKPGDPLPALVFGFTQPGDYEIHRIALTEQCRAIIDPIKASDPRSTEELTISGRAVAGVAAVKIQFAPDKGEGTAVEKQAPVQNGQFKITLSQQDISAGYAYQVTVAPAEQVSDVSPAQRLFVFPRVTDKRSSPVTREGPDLLCEGKRFGFIGVNYTRLDLGLGNKADYEVIAHDVLQMKRWGVRVVRLPSNVGLVQPEPGVFPDNPRYAELLKSHNLDPRYLDQMDYFVSLAGQLGIYTVIDWHSTPNDPYRYFVGGNPADRGTGKPGKAIAYLAPSDTEGGELDLSNPLHLKTLMDAHRWIARHYRGNPNVLGIEIPHNEPHSKYMAVEANWRRIVNECAKAVAEGDPDRLTFVMAPSYSHNNLLPSDTWLLPDRASGAAPHFYQANGPVPLRPDAKTFKSPWLARDQEATFGWGFVAATMPLSAVDYPFYNGESGRYGHDTLLPNDPDGPRALVESQLVQEYAAGMSGRTEWTMWGNKGDFEPYRKMYKQQFLRFAPVFEAGPLDRLAARVAFVQSGGAAKSANGYNFACIPFAKAALDVHLSPAHYLTDSQFLFFASAELSVGLEQVVETSESLQYKAYIVDRRNLDPRAEALLKGLADSVLWLDSAEDLTAEKLSDFLKRAGVAVDTKSPREIQLVEGPAHLIAYRRLAGESNEATIYPILHRTGRIELLDEAGKSVFKGTAAELAEKGVAIDLPRWQSAIYRIQPSP